MGDGDCGGCPGDGGDKGWLGGGGEGVGGGGLGGGSGCKSGGCGGGDGGGGEGGGPGGGGGDGGKGMRLWSMKPLSWILHNPPPAAALSCESACWMAERIKLTSNSDRVSPTMTIVYVTGVVVVHVPVDALLS